MDTELTIGLITCNRYNKLKECLYSLKSNLKNIKYNLVIVNGCVDKRVIEIVKKVGSNITLITPEQRIGPSAARKLITEATETEYLLFLDDDIIVKEEPVKLLLKHLYNSPEVSIASGPWKEYGKFRELGQIFIFGKREKTQYVFKKFIKVSEAKKLGVTSIKVHGVMSSMLVRTEIFKRINFDERYNFFYELFDFFMQAYNKKITIEALPDAIFEHKPGKYRGITMRKLHSPEEDKKKFIEKWGVVPVGELSLPIYKSVQYQIRRRLGF